MCNKTCFSTTVLQKQIYSALRKKKKSTTGSDFMWTHCLGWSHLTGFETEHPFKAGWKLLEGGIDLT